MKRTAIGNQTILQHETDDLWIFGYGSLIWRPGFSFLAAERGHAHGFHRSLCVHSVVHRGTPQRPGLVLGLDRGGSCQGLVFRVSRDDRDPVISYLRERELVTNVYREHTVRVRLSSGRQVHALAYVVDRRHDQYAGALDIHEAARRVRGAVGEAGPNEEYVINTVDHLQDMGIRDNRLEQVAALVG